MTTAETTILVADSLAKSFGATKALAGVSLDLRRGEIHALLGGNGSGKSTFIKALAGVQPADSGALSFRGSASPAADMTPSRARDVGLRFVHQNHSTFGGLTVLENLYIGQGFHTRSLGRLRWRRLHRESKEVLEQFGISARPDDLLGDLGPATQAMVAIARSLMGQEAVGDHILVLDEPTASLPAHEVEQLLTSLKEMASRGNTILYVTHRLNEVLEIADTATVFRDGHVVADLRRGELSHAVLVEKIMGRKVEAILEAPKAEASSQVVLDVQGLAGGPIVDATFQVRAGEIVGIAGVLGSGRSSLLRMLFGDLPAATGTIKLDGRTVHLNRPLDGMAAGIALVPEDRASDAVFPEMPVTDNLGICVTGNYYRHGRYDHRRERHEAHELVERFMIKVPSISAPISTLSGGNQQKVIIGRWMRREPRILLLDEPTQGVDVGARAEIWMLVRQAAAAGAAVLVVSSDFHELPGVCDRALVLRGGRLVSELVGDTLTEHNVTHTALIDEVA